MKTRSYLTTLPYARFGAACEVTSVIWMLGMTFH
jgi:hypothetical protein